MGETNKTVTRTDLYEAVWSKALYVLAKEWNTTSLRLVRVCDEMEVPRPGPGHWQLIARGLIIEKEPLSPPAEGIPLQVVLVPQGVRQTKKAKGQKQSEQSPPAPAVEEKPEFDIAQAAEQAVLDVIRQVKRIDFWADKITETTYQSQLSSWFKLDKGVTFTDGQLLRALRKVRKEYRSFLVNVVEAINQYNPSSLVLTIDIVLRDGFEWKDAWEEAWSFAESPNPYFLSDNALNLYTWAKGAKNTCRLTNPNKIGAQARLRKTYSNIEDHLEEIRFKADPTIQWESGGSTGWRSQLRVWFAKKDVVYYRHGPLNPALELNVLEVCHAELERFKAWLYEEIMQPGFPVAKETVGIYDIHDRKTLKMVFGKLPADCVRWGNVPDFFKVLKLIDGLEMRYSFKDGCGPWLAICQPQEGVTWREIKARLRAKSDEIPLEKRYNLSIDARKLLRWILDLNRDEYLLQMTPSVEDRLETELGIDVEWDKENLRAYLELLLEEINEKTEFKLRAISWLKYSETSTRILVKRKEVDLDGVVRAIQVLGLKQNKLLDGDKIRATVGGIIDG